VNAVHTTSFSRRRFRRLAAMAGVAAVGLVAAACSSGSSSPTTTAASTGTTSGAPVTLTLGYLTNLTHAPALIGVQEGFFTKNLPSNVTLSTSTYNAGPAEVTALLAGSLDAAYMGPNSAITAYAHDKAIRIISGATSGGAALVVSSSITSPSQLKGKTLATPQLGNTQDVALRTWLKKQSLTFPGPNGGSGEVTILPEANATTVTSFEAGTIAGAWVPEPYVAEMVAKGGHVLVNEKTQWPNGQFSTTVLVVAAPFLNAHPSVVTALLKGQLAADAFIKSSPTAARTDANAALATLTGKSLSTSELDAAWADMTFTNDPLASTIATDEAHAKAAGFATTDISGIYDLGPVNQLLTAQGKPTVPS
jgi:NitT/TauT family transport system substrate-binding protein